MQVYYNSVDGAVASENSLLNNTGFVTAKHIRYKQITPIDDDNARPCVVIGFTGYPGIIIEFIGYLGIIIEFTGYRVLLALVSAICTVFKGKTAIHRFSIFQ